MATNPQLNTLISKVISLAKRMVEWLRIVRKACWLITRNYFRWHTHTDRQDRTPITYFTTTQHSSPFQHLLIPFYHNILKQMLLSRRRSGRGHCKDNCGIGVFGGGQCNYKDKCGCGSHSVGRGHCGSSCHIYSSCGNNGQFSGGSSIELNCVNGFNKNEYGNESSYTKILCANSGGVITGGSLKMLESCDAMSNDHDDDLKEETDGLKKKNQLEIFDHSIPSPKPLISFVITSCEGDDNDVLIKETGGLKKNKNQLEIFNHSIPSPKPLISFVITSHEGDVKDDNDVQYDSNDDDVEDDNDYEQNDDDQYDDDVCVVFMDDDDDDDDIIFGYGNDQDGSAEINILRNTQESEDDDDDDYDDDDDDSVSIISVSEHDDDDDDEMWVYDEEEDGDQEEEDINIFSTTTMTKSIKRVRFSKKIELILDVNRWTVEELMGGRVGGWEEMARDRNRFKRRVEAVGEAIEYVLHSLHRAAVFERLYGKINEFEHGGGDMVDCGNDMSSIHGVSELGIEHKLVNYEGSYVDRDKGVLLNNYGKSEDGIEGEGCCVDGEGFMSEMYTCKGDGWGEGGNYFDYIKLGIIGVAGVCDLICGSDGDCGDFHMGSCVGYIHDDDCSSSSGTSISDCSNYVLNTHIDPFRVKACIINDMDINQIM